MKKAWELEWEIRKNAVPVVLTEEEQTWEAIKSLSAISDQQIRMFWDSRVPGSGAPECLMIAATQAVANKGYNVSQAEQLLPVGLQALQENNLPVLHKVTAEIWYELSHAPMDQESPYWHFQLITTWPQHEKAVGFPSPKPISLGTQDFSDRIYAGWLGQICAGAFGTCLEGYTGEQLAKHFGKVRGYVRTPNTFNDDVTYELAFLEAFSRKGYDVTSRDIAGEWVALVPFGWSAEHVALQNLKLGVFPPESGMRNNPFSEWIGAQMRGAIAGMVAPGDPRQAARLAWIDGVISHSANGVLGEVFNAIMVSLAFSGNDVRNIVEAAIELLPKSSEYYSVVSRALQACKYSTTWEGAWRICFQGMERYNWIHSYPNAMAEIVALWFGNGDFTDTMEVIAGCGLDVDCNAAQIGAVLGVMQGSSLLSDAWIKPIGDRLQTYCRGKEELSIEKLTVQTIQALQKWSKG